MQPGKQNLITDVAGLSVGQAEDHRVKTGVSVVVGDAPMVASVHVMGGAPGTRETDLLAPDKTVQTVNALVLSGGSAIGLGAVDGVVGAMRAEGIGFDARGQIVPIVPGAILFDLANGGAKDWGESPYPDLGRAAYAARGAIFDLGTAGAGTGAMVADVKGGLGSASCILPSGATVGALVAVNAFGQVTTGADGRFWAAPFEQGDEFGGLGVEAAPAGPARTKASLEENTTIAIVATDSRLTKAEAHRMAVAAHDGMARAVVPSHTPFDGDLVFAASTGQREATEEDRFLLGHVAALCLARAIARGVYAATPAEGDPMPTWASRFS